MKILSCRRLSLIKLDWTGRKCSNDSKSTSNLLNPFSLSILKGYKPKDFETPHKNVASIQDSSFQSDKTFSMLFPPPNVTGNLHLGHALTATIQDVLIRWKQKQNYKTLWIPGTDHAGIASQVVVEKTLLKSTGKTRHDFTRDEFLAEMWKWKNEKGSSIVDDLKKLGTSFNWDREYFTLNENMSNAVNEAFIRLFEKKLIYRAQSLINWSCSLESAISDVEVENLEIEGMTEVAVPNYDRYVIFGLISNIAYKVVGSEEEIIVSTTRPETLLGDVAIAVHPDDARYSHLRNSKLWHPYRNEEIDLIFDESVEREFGTGAVKITPAHDKNDFEMAKRHNLQHIQVIDEKGSIAEGFEGFSGLPRFNAREKILHDLADKKLYRGQKSHKMILPICSRSKDVIEFLLRPQWFIKCDEMAKKAVEAVEQGKLKIHPKTFEKEWNRWLNNSRDWCISRQLIWGHQIPAYRIKHESEEIWIAAKSEEEAKTKFKSQFPNIMEFQIKRDSDVLDTWFSSGLLPFSVFGWPQTNKEFSKLFPLNLMETGHDILFFWIARMVMLSMELTGQIPFDEVLLHGIICDAFGRKMSKSLGNVILPSQVINGATLKELQDETLNSVKRGILSEHELKLSLDGQKKMYPDGIKECGIDALRFTLMSSNIKQHFINFDIIDCNTNTKFFNKIFNCVKFANTIANNSKVVVKDIKDLKLYTFSDMDRWLLSRLGNMIKTIENSMKNYNFHLATAALKTFFYDECCNVYVETAKSNRFKTVNEITVSSAVALNTSLAIALEYLEIFSPFFSGKIRQFLPQNVDFKYEDFVDEKLESEIRDLLQICESIRELKAECRITSKIPSEVYILAKSPEAEKLIKNHYENVRQLTFSDNISISTNQQEFESKEFLIVSTAGHLCSLGVNYLEKQHKKVESTVNLKKVMKLQSELDNLLKGINHPNYTAKANEKVQQKHREKVEKLTKEIEAIKQLLHQP